MNLISEDPRQRPYVKPAFLSELVAHLRQLQLPGYKAVNIGGEQNKLAPTIQVLFASEPSLTQGNDGGGVFSLLVKEVSQVKDHESLLLQSRDTHKPHRPCTVDTAKKQSAHASIGGWFPPLIKQTPGPCGSAAGARAPPASAPAQ